jgi:ferritin-like protein
MAAEALHEDESKLRPETTDMHRAIRSLMEEVEAVDWYQQRVDACQDETLARILAHNRDEEKEHAAMVLEWIRRQDPKFDEELRKYLFQDAALEEELEETGHGSS